MAGDLLEQGLVGLDHALARDGDFFLAGFDGSLAHDLAVRGRPGVPDVLVHHEDERVVHVAPQGHMFLGHGVELGGQVDGQGVFLAVHGAAGHGGLRVGPAHLGGVGPQRREGVEEQRRADHADLQSLEVGRRLDGPLGVRDLPVAVLAPGERHNAGLLEGLEEALADFALRDRVHRGVVGEEEGQGEEVERLDLRRPVDGGTHGHVDHALAQRAELAGLITLDERDTRIELDVDAALRAFAHLVRPEFATLAPREGGAHHQRHAVFALVVLRGGRCRAEREGGRGGHGSGEEGAQLHGSSPVSRWFRKGKKACGPQ